MYYITYALYVLHFRRMLELCSKLCDSFMLPNSCRVMILLCLFKCMIRYILFVVNALNVQYVLRKLSMLRSSLTVGTLFDGHIAKLLVNHSYNSQLWTMTKFHMAL